MNTKFISKLLVNRPKTVLLVFTILTLIVGINISNLYMQSDLTTYLSKDDSRIQLWNKINQEFKVGSTIIIIVDQHERSYDIRDPEVLKEIDEISSSRLINPEEDDSDGIVSIRSIASYIKTENNDRPTAESILKGENGYKIPDDINIIEDYFNRETVNSLKNALFTDDLKYCVIIIQLTEDANFDKVLSNTEKAVENRGTTYADMTITGTVAYQKAIQENSMNNLLLMFPIALALISLVIFLFNRNIKAIIISFLPPAFALVLTFGFLGVFYPELSLISVAIVALLMGLGVDYSIHLMNRIVEEKSVENKIDRIDKTLRFTGKAVLLSTITTIIGFASLMISSMSPMVAFGLGCSVGIFFCFISAMIVVPCTVIILDFHKKAELPSWKRLANFTIKNRYRIITISSFFVIMSLILIPQIETDVNYSELDPKGLPEVEGMKVYSEKFGGGANFNALLIETESQGLTDQNTINEIAEMEEKIRRETEEVGHEVSVASIADAFVEITDQLSRFEIIQQLANLTALQDVLQLEGIERALFNKIADEGLIDEDYSMTVVLVSIPTGKSMKELEVIVNRINKIAAETKLSNNGHVSELTGQDAITVAVNKKLTDEQTRSMIIAILFVLAALIIIFNSTKYGVLTIIPISFVLAWEPAFLVTLGISLDVITIAIASIMIGIGIDYGIHITQRIREGLADGLSKTDATREAIEKTGLSLVESAATTIAGLSAIYFINIPALQEFGLIVIIMTALSCIAAALILPVFFCSRIIK